MKSSSRDRGQIPNPGAIWPTMFFIRRGRSLNQFPLSSTQRPSSLNFGPRSRRWHSPQATPNHPKTTSWIVYPTTVLVLSGAIWLTYDNSRPFRHVVLAGVRCFRVASEPCFPSSTYRGLNCMMPRRGDAKCCGLQIAFLVFIHLGERPSEGLLSMSRAECPSRSRGASRKRGCASVSCGCSNCH